MKLVETVGGALLVGALLVALSGCEEQGPLEEAGEEVDDKVEETGEAIEDATDGN